MVSFPNRRTLPRIIHVVGGLRVRHRQRPDGLTVRLGLKHLHNLAVTHLDAPDPAFHRRGRQKIGRRKEEVILLDPHAAGALQLDQLVEVKAEEFHQSADADPGSLDGDGMQPELPTGVKVKSLRVVKEIPRMVPCCLIRPFSMLIVSLRSGDPG